MTSARKCLNPTDVGDGNELSFRCDTLSWYMMYHSGKQLILNLGYHKGFEQNNYHHILFQNLLLPCLTVDTQGFMVP